MKKKLLAVSLVMAMCLLSACGGESNDSKKKDKEEKTTQESHEEEKTEEITVEEEIVEENQGIQIADEVVSIIAGKAVKNDQGQEISLCAEVFLNQEKVKELGIENIEETLKKDVSKVTRDLPVWKRVTKTEIRETEFNKTTTNKIKR